MWNVPREDMIAPVGAPAAVKKGRCTSVKLSVIVPFYKCRAAVRPLYSRLLSSCEPLGMDLEFLFIEDCGGDGSWEAIEELARLDSRVKAVQFSRNFGQHHALTAGLDLCTGDWAVTMDCDLQTPPEEIPRLYARALEGFDVVYGRRMARKDRDPLWRRAVSSLYHRAFFLLTGIRTDPRVASFRLLSRKVIDGFKTMREQSRKTGSQINWLGFPTAWVDVEHHPRFEGKSSYSFRKLFNFALDGIIAYSDKPLRISIRMGFLISLFSLLWAAALTVRKLVWGSSVEGWTSIMVSLWFLGGLVVFNLGVIGLYLGKVFDETKGRPLYVISRKINL